MVNYTAVQMMSWYRNKMLRIQHGNLIPNKRYLSNEEVVKLFTGTVEIQEQLDGNLLDIPIENNNRQLMAIDISEKDTKHEHVIEYKDMGKINMLDIVYQTGSCGVYFEGIYGSSTGPLAYATLILEKPTLSVIYNVLEALSKLPSHLGSPEIKGLVIKNYRSQLMGKYVNEKFEDKLE